MALDFDGIQTETTRGYVGKDGFFWWVGEVEDNEDPMELGRVRVRILGYYTNFRGGTSDSLPTNYLPWATVLQHTSQAGNDGQGESSGQLQPGAIVMGFFLDGEYAQMPMVLGVMRVQKSERTTNTRLFSFSDQIIPSGNAVNHSAIHPAEKNAVNPKYQRQGIANTVAFPGLTTASAGGVGSALNIGSEKGIPGSSTNSIKPINGPNPIPIANGIGGPWKTMEYKLSYLIEDVANVISSLVKTTEGNYIDIINGKLVTKAELTRSIQNYLSTVYAQVISAMRESLVNLATDLKTSKIITYANGTPFAVYNAVQTAVTTILTKCCTQDAMIDSYIESGTKPVLDIVDQYLISTITKTEMIGKTVNEVVDTVVCTVQSIITDTKDTVDTIKGIFKNDAEALEIVESWEKGQVYSNATNMTMNGQTNLTGIMKTLITFNTAGCVRKSYGAEELSGWWPLFGVVKTPERLEQVKVLKGDSRGKCGNASSSNDLFSTIFTDADQHVSASKNYPNGAYDLWLGNPGRQGQVNKRTNGTTHTSVLYNNAHFAEKIARDKFRREYPNASTQEIDTKIAEYIRTTTEGKGDTGSLVADHISYAGTLTQEVHGDDCKLVNNNHVLTVDGDYHLKITGNCHIEVGGGFYFSAEGAPISGKGIQKHAIKFGSDVDMNVVGAKFELQASETTLSAAVTKITGNLYENSCQQQTNSAIEMIFTTENTMVMSTPHLLQLINIESQVTPKINTGIRTVVVGGSETYINPTNAADYRINLTNRKAAYNETITQGLYSVKIGDTSVVSHSS